jgi:hypothetical protein
MSPGPEEHQVPWLSRGSRYGACLYRSVEAPSVSAQRINGEHEARPAKKFHHLVWPGQDRIDLYGIKA